MGYVWKAVSILAVTSVLVSMQEEPARNTGLIPGTAKPVQPFMAATRSSVRKGADTTLPFVASAKIIAQCLAPAQTAAREAGADSFNAAANGGVLTALNEQIAAALVVDAVVPVTMSDFPACKFMVIGRMKSTFLPALNDVERRAIEQINEQKQAALDRLERDIRDSNASDGASPDTIRRRAQQRTAIIKDANKRIDEVNSAAAARRPSHVFYVLTSDTSVKTWKPMETKTVKGVIRQAAIYLEAMPFVVNGLDKDVHKPGKGVFCRLELVLVTGDDVFGRPPKPTP